MINYLILAGLIFEIIGVGILLRDELTPLAARLKQEKSKIKVTYSQKFILWLAILFGSDNPLDTESYVIDSYSKRFYGFVMLLLGFAIQAIAVIIQIKST